MGKQISLQVESTPFRDRNKKKIMVGDICKYNKTIGGDFVFVVIRRGKEFGLHRQGLWKDFCQGVWDYTQLEAEAYDKILEVWKENGKDYYATFDEYLNRYCVVVVGNIQDNSHKFDLDPRYKRLK